MATYVLVHGGGADSWSWHLVAPRLQALGHDVVAPDLPCADGTAGLAEYADAVVRAVGERTAVVLVAHSMGALTAPVVATRVPVDLLVLVAPMVPAPGERAGDWWTATRQVQARRALDEEQGRDPDADPDPRVLFLHDVPDDVVAALDARGEPAQADRPFLEPWPLSAWPDVPTEVLVGTRDRLFPLGFQRRLVRERLGIEPDEIDTGHVPALADPDGLVQRLEAYRVAHGLPGGHARRAG